MLFAKSIAAVQNHEKYKPRATVWVCVLNRAVVSSQMFQSHKNQTRVPGAHDALPATRLDETRQESDETQGEPDKA